MAKNEEMDYCVTYAIDARHAVHVRAKSISEALEKAEGEYLDADFGELHDVVQARPVAVETKEDIVWEA